MPGFTISVQDAITPDVRRIIGTLGGGRVMQVMSRGMAEVVRKHFFKMDNEHPNAMGGRRTHFFGQAARGTHRYSDETQAVVSVNQVGIRQHLFGGDIYPVNAKALTIPAIPEAYGKRAREFDGLKLVWPKGSNIGWLQADGEVTAAHGEKRPAMRYRKSAPGSSRKRYGPGEHGFQTSVEAEPKGKIRAGEIFFWLVRHVSQAGHPERAPDEQAISTAARHAADIFYRSQLRRTGHA